MDIFTHWREVARRWSFWLALAASALLSFFQFFPDAALQVWNALPPDVTARISQSLGFDVAAGLAIAANIAMFIRQEAVRDKLAALVRWFRDMGMSGDISGAASARNAGIVGVIGAGAAALVMVIVPAYEGKRNDPYLDAVKVLTVCYGHTGNIERRRYSDTECQTMLDQDLARHAAPVLACVPQLRGHDHQLAASVSLAYNIGAGAFCKSSVAAAFRRGDDRAACAGFDRWVYAGGKKLPGLVKRRASERALCEKGL